MIERIIRDRELAERLGLTEDQIRTLKDGVYKLKLQEIDLRAALEKSAMEQAKLMTAEKVDEKALMDAVEKTGSIRTELAKLRVKGLMLLRDTLTGEQIKEIREQHRKMADRIRREGRRKFGRDRRHFERRPDEQKAEPDGAPPPSNE
jgi:Spy/CpxP family protein refolding chaperone